jgi:putative tryptophan/tyrosine transport system substrate-binding protein
MTNKEETMNIRKIITGAAIFMAATLFSVDAGAEKKIGVLMFSDETRYVEAARGITDKLKEMGFAEPKASFLVEKAGANKARAADLVQQYAAAKLDLIITLGTSSTIAISREIKNVPVVFSMVYDPVDAGIAKAWKSSGNNTTGTSPKIPMSKPMEMLGNFARVKRLAVLYTPGEKNSETQLKDLQAVEPNYKIKIIPVRFTRVEEVDQLLPEVLRTADALYITGSNLVNSQVSTISDMAARAEVITVTHLEDLVVKGVLLGVCSNPYSEGQLAGEKAAKVLKGTKPSAIPIESARKSDVIINMKSAKKGRFQIPPEFMKTATKTIE